MLHEGSLALAPYTLLSVASAATAVLFALAVALRVRRGHMLVATVAFLLLSAWFAGLAITAGPLPVVVRAQIAEPMRWIAFSASVFWWIWLIVYAFSLIRIEHR